MRGDTLASGGRSAVFSVAPNLKFNEAKMHDDLKKLSEVLFCDTYMITHQEYTLMKSAQESGNEERLSDFAATLRDKIEATSRVLAADAAQEQSLRRECFITPRAGTVIVDRDVPPKPRGVIIAPPKAQQSRQLLPTTGHVIKVGEGADLEYYGAERGPDDFLMGKRVLFQQMSGQAICFTGYPTWIQLSTGEIMGIVDREDISVLEEKLESMV